MQKSGMKFCKKSLNQLCTFIQNYITLLKPQKSVGMERFKAKLVREEFQGTTIVGDWERPEPEPERERLRKLGGGGGGERGGGRKRMTCGSVL
jgi:hypothetical protein